MTIDSVDVTPLGLTVSGIVLLISYLVFAHLVTHRGDFYHIRRWKAALSFATIFGVILLVVLMAPSVSSTAGDLAKKSVLEIIGSLSGTFFSVLAFVMPPLFVIVWGTHHRLKWWLNSDDFLDKIWKDPDKGHKDPVQEL